MPAAILRKDGAERGGPAAGPRGPLAVPEARLLKDVDELGTKGTVVDVSKGYLRNFLIPRKLAAPATRGAIDAARRPARPARAPAGRTGGPPTGCGPGAARPGGRAPAPPRTRSS